MRVVELGEPDSAVDLVQQRAGALEFAGGFEVGVDVDAFEAVGRQPPRSTGHLHIAEGLVAEARLKGPLGTIQHIGVLLEN